MKTKKELETENADLKNQIMGFRTRLDSWGTRLEEQKATYLKMKHIAQARGEMVSKLLKNIQDHYGYDL